MDATHDKRKARLGGLFKKKDKDIISEPSQQESKSSFNSNERFDSAYSSSEARSNLSDANVVPMENHGQLRGIDSGRNLALNESNGDVLDGDTGEIISTVTTTTTTTTTTTSRRGRDGETTVHVSTQPAQQNPQAHVAPTSGSQTNGPPVNVPQTNIMPQSSPPVSSMNEGQMKIPQITEPQPDTTRFGGTQAHTPLAEVHADPIQSQPWSADLRNPSQPQQSHNPTIPIRNPERKSREYTENTSITPSSPPRPNPNFSYPTNRSSSNLHQSASGEQYSQPTPQSSGTLSDIKAAAAAHANGGALGNLKAAAIGLHGVGEQLRGTFNNEFDQRLHRPDSDRAAYARAKNQAVLDRGQQEMNGLDSVRSRNAQSVPHQTQPYHHHEAGYSDPAVSPIQPTESIHNQRWDQAQPQAQPQPQRDMDKMPMSFSPESTRKEEKTGLRKLIKKR